MSRVSPFSRSMYSHGEIEKGKMTHCSDLLVLCWVSGCELETGVPRSALLSSGL